MADSPRQTELPLDVDSEPDDPHSTSHSPQPFPGGDGRDEMNLAEHPFATLARRGDSREDIVHDTWITDSQGNRRHQVWRITAPRNPGLPTEFDERVYVALMYLTSQQDFRDRRVTFTVSQLIRVMGIGHDQRSYDRIEEALKRLVGATIYAEGSFWDNQTKEWATVKAGFHIMDRFWLRYKETNPRVIEQERCAAYIVWSEDIWASFRAGYVKRLDLGIFYSFDSALTRRLYRFLDKRMHYQDEYEIDVFELAARLGMVRYEKPAHVRQKIQPAFDELTRRGWLKSAETVKRGQYTRFRFVRNPNFGAKTQPAPEPDGEGENPPQLASMPPISSLDELWSQALEQLRWMMTRATFEAWFPRTRLLGLQDGVATIEVPDDRSRDWIAGRLDRIIREALLGCGEVVQDLRLVVHT